LAFGKRGGSPGGISAGSAAKPPESNAEPALAPDAPSNVYVMPAPRQQASPGKSKPSHAQLNEMLMAACAEEGRIHTETYLTTLGALIGFSVQRWLWEDFLKTGRRAIKEIFLTLGLANGETAFVSPIVDEMLTTPDRTKGTIVPTVCLPMMRAGLKPLPNCQEMVSWRNATVGGPNFGAPRIAPPHQPHVLRRAALNRLWGPTRRLLERNAIPPMYWSVELTAAALHTINQTTQVLSPAISATLVLEAAIAMSVVDPATVPED
jgi:hypothetical protein